MGIFPISENVFVLKDQNIESTGQILYFTGTVLEKLYLTYYLGYRDIQTRKEFQVFHKRNAQLEEKCTCTQNLTERKWRKVEVVCIQAPDFCDNSVVMS